MGVLFFPKNIATLQLLPYSDFRLENQDNSTGTCEIIHALLNPVNILPNIPFLDLFSDPWSDLTIESIFIELSNIS